MLIFATFGAISRLFVKKMQISLDNDWTCGTTLANSKEFCLSVRPKELTAD